VPRRFISLDELLGRERPDYVIVSTNWPTTPVVTRELVARGVRVLAETPPAPDLDGLRALWADVGSSGLVQVAEQYLLMPAHAARRAVLAAGTIGQVTSVQISSDASLSRGVAVLRAARRRVRAGRGLTARRSRAWGG
jgi:predicted dehydrogenase